MPQRRPITPRPPVMVRAGAIVLALAGLALATRTTFTSGQWIGRVFPGFVLLDNRVVASVGLGHWPGAGIPGLYQSEVVAVDGRPVQSTPEVYAAVGTHAPGDAVRYRVRSEGVEREVEIPAQRFELRDWILLFGTFLLNGTAFLAGGLITWVLRPRAPVARALLGGGLSTSFFLFTAMDLYGPATFFRLHVVCEALLPGSMLGFALLFPQPHPLAHLWFAGYALSLAITVPYEAFLYHPVEYSRVLRTDMLYLALVAIFFVTRLVLVYWRSPSQLARQRVRMIMLGALFGFTVPGVVLLLAAVMAGGMAMNTAAFTPFIFFIALAYAVVKHDVFEIDAMVKRGAYYLALTGAVGAAYVAAVLALNLILRAGAVTDTVVFPVLFAFAVLLLFNPLRTRLQAFIDRMFFGTRYDSAEVLAEVGAALARAMQRDQIVDIVRKCVDSAVPNAATRLFVAAATGGELREVDGRTTVPAAAAERLAQGRLLTAVDPPEAYPDGRSYEAVRAALAEVGASIVVPLQVGGDLVGALAAGEKRSALFYTAGDAEFLRALAHGTAIALQNAASYEALAELNASLENRVRERTAQLEAANGELARAYEELKSTEAQLVHSEKMASLGRLVAGVAHEINNPVSFIANSVAPLRRRLANVSAAPPERAAALLREADELIGIMAKGAERATAIVKDLRSFSRLDEATWKRVDLHEGLDVSLRLLEPRWRDRIVVHRDYGELPLVECDPGQINQVIVNVLANACDAIDGSGNVWISTRADDGHVTVTIRDDGIGMAPDVVGRIFDPFFTTKDVGAGTGLGLAISHGIIAAHAGRIDVDSTPGAGSTFRIVLPTAAKALDRAGRVNR